MLVKNQTNLEDKMEESVNMQESMNIGEPTESVIREMVNKLPPEKQKMFWVKYESQKKDPMTAALLCFFLGGFGVHRFYLGQTQLGIAYFIACFVLATLPIYTSFIEAFFAPGYTRKLNEQRAMELLKILDGSTVIIMTQ